MELLSFSLSWVILLLPSQREPTIKPAPEKGTFLGVLVAPVPEPLYEHLPQLQGNQGVLVTHVLLDSPAAEEEIRKHDILLGYDNHVLTTTEQFAKLIQNDKPNRIVNLKLLRKGKVISQPVTLTLGPALLLASPKKTPSGSSGAVAKPAPNPALSVSVTPLDNDEMRVTFEYYQEGTGRLRTYTCEGSTADLGQEIRKLPANKQRFAEAVLDRLRHLQTQR